MRFCVLTCRIINCYHSSKHIICMNPAVNSPIPTSDKKLLSLTLQDLVQHKMKIAPSTNARQNNIVGLQLTGLNRLKCYQIAVINLPLH